MKKILLALLLTGCATSPDQAINQISNQCIALGYQYGSDYWAGCISYNYIAYLEHGQELSATMMVPGTEFLMAGQKDKATQKVVRLKH